MAVNGVRTTEYIPQHGSVSAPKEGTAQIGNIFNGKNTSETQENSIKKFIELAIKDYGIEYNDAINFINKSFGITEDEFYNLEEDKKEFIVQVLLSALESASESARFDIKVFNNIAEYYKLSKENGLDDKQAQSIADIFANKNTLDILKAYCSELQKYNNLSEIPQEKLTEAFAKIRTKMETIGIAKAPQLLASLLDRIENDEEKAVLNNAYNKTVSSEDKVQGLKVTISKYKDEKKLQAFLQKFSPEAIQALGLNPDDIAKFNHLLAANLDKEGCEELQRLHFELAEKVHARMQEIKSKKEEDYTDEDRKILESLGYIKRAFAGHVTGYQANKNLSTDIKKEYSSNVLDKSKEVDIYDDVLTNIVALTNDKTGIVNMTDEEKEIFSSFMNELTNNDYSKTVETYNNEVANTNTKHGAESNSGIGLNNNQDLNIEQKRQAIEEKKQELKNNSDEKTSKFEVEKTPKKSEVKTVTEAKQFAGSFVKVIENFKQYGDQVMEDAAKTVARFGRSTQVYYANLCSNMKFTNAIERNNNGWTLEQIRHLNLSFTQRQEMTEKAEKREKENAPQRA